MMVINTSRYNEIDTPPVSLSYTLLYDMSEKEAISLCYIINKTVTHAEAKMIQIYIFFISLFAASLCYIQLYVVTDFCNKLHCPCCLIILSKRDQRA